MVVNVVLEPICAVSILSLHKKDNFDQLKLLTHAKPLFLIHAKQPTQAFQKIIAWF
jgi:hypothetical protein